MSCSSLLFIKKDTFWIKHKICKLLNYITIEPTHIFLVTRPFRETISSFDLRFHIKESLITSQNTRSVLAYVNCLFLNLFKRCSANIILRNAELDFSYFFSFANLCCFSKTGIYHTIFPKIIWSCSSFLPKNILKINAFGKYFGNLDFLI